MKREAPQQRRWAFKAWPIELYHQESQDRLSLLGYLRQRAQNGHSRWKQRPWRNSGERFSPGIILKRP
jgi:hypothetical protein